MEILETPREFVIYTLSTTAKGRVESTFDINKAIFNCVNLLTTVIRQNGSIISVGNFKWGLATKLHLAFSRYIEPTNFGIKSMFFVNIGIKSVFALFNVIWISNDPPSPDDVDPAIEYRARFVEEVVLLKEKCRVYSEQDEFTSRYVRLHLIFNKILAITK
jgi:hypothetical protein